MQDEELSIRGSLSESSLHELLASISRSRETGTLNFHDMGRWKAVYFKEGQIIFATSNLPDDRLGEYLIKQGKITVRQFLEGSKLVRPGKRFGAIMVEQNILSPDELIAAIQGHVEEIVYGLFDWLRGEYEFVIKDLSAQGPITLQLNTEDVILEGIRRINDFSRIYAGLGSIDRILRVSDIADNLTYKLELDSDESQVLSLSERDDEPRADTLVELPLQFRDTQNSLRFGRGWSSGEARGRRGEWKGFYRGAGV